MAKHAVIAKVTAASGKRDELVAVFAGMVDAVRNEDGTELYALLTDKTNADVVWFWEMYSDQAAVDAHTSGEAMKAVGAKLGGLIAPGGFELIFVEPVAAKGLALS
jgi:quinol monooxygenase YgiN